ncbi:MAG: hypothetical protein FWF84_05205, partial [Kiritimatiellaeota bacterium]|nr:hypothetical protein [Kiritimatiellota bacterium]
GDQVDAGGHERGVSIEGLGKTAVELRSAGHNGMSVAGSGEGMSPWVTLFAGASSRGGQEAPGIAQYTVKDGGRLFVRDLWYEGNAWSMVHLKGRGELAMHGIYMCPADRNHLDRTTEWEKEIRANRAAYEFDNFSGNVTFSLLSTSDGTVRVVPPSPNLKLYLVGFSTSAEVDFGGEAMNGSAISHHRRAPKQDSHPDYPWQHTGTMAMPDHGAPSPEFTTEMLAPLRTLKPQHIGPRADHKNDIRLYRIWAIGRHGLRIQSAQHP